MSNTARLKAILASKTARALDLAEDPREMLDADQDEQYELLQRLRSGVADIATARRRVELQGQEAAARYVRLEAQARQALEQGQENVARAALERRVLVAQHVDDLRVQHEHLRQQQSRLQRTERSVSERLEAFRLESETMKATYAASIAQVHANEALAGIGPEMTASTARLDRAKSRILDMQARADATEEILSDGLASAASRSDDDFDRTLTGGSDLIERQLEALRASPSRPRRPAEAEAADDAWLSITD